LERVALKSIVLINPPVAKPCEPPAGIARLAGALRQSGLDCRVIDASIGGLNFLLGKPVYAEDTWTHRAAKNREQNLKTLQTHQGYASFDRYKRAVADIGRAVEKSVPGKRVKAGIANYQDRELSPVRSQDLLSAAAAPESNPFYDYFADNIMPQVTGSAVDAVGISLGFLSQALCGFALIGLLKRQRPDLKIILGGGLITSWIRRPGWRNPFTGLVDHMVDGPGEEVLLGLLGKSGERRGFAPDYSDLKNNGYLSPGFILPYSASSGCYWHRCSFCPERAEKNPWDPIPASKVISDLKGLIEKTAPTLVHLLDNAIQPALLKALAQDPIKVPWYGFVRLTRQLCDPDFCNKLKQSGCVMLKIGLESGDQAVLDALEKGTDLTTAARVLANLKKAGIATYVYLLFGTPQENEPAANRTMDFTVCHSGEIGFLNLALFNLPIHGPDTRDIETRDFYSGDLSFYREFEHPLGWGRPQVRSFIEKTFKKHPEIAPIIRRDPPVFTSNHAPFFTTQY
jgi:hypothetical protein